MVEDTSAKWAYDLGLAMVPLFPTGRSEPAGQHTVLLNGRLGSFVISEVAPGDVDPYLSASWIWSADIPHQVFVLPDKVTVARWDDMAATRTFSRLSTERQLDTFYDYLLLDRVSSKQDVVEHSIEMFRRIRSLAYELGGPDDASIHLFLFILASMLSGMGAEAVDAGEQLAEEYSINPDYLPLLQRLDRNTLNALVQQFANPATLRTPPHLIPELMVHHAGGIVFQEAHYELRRWDPTDLFGIPGVAQVKVKKREGTHFTPPSLARTVVEQALPHLKKHDRITLFDPACGSGAFIQEAVRALAMEGYAGRVRIVGWDISGSAVAMAKFALGQLVREQLGLSIDSIELNETDSLQEDQEWPRADLIVMNPPFISWGALSPAQRSQLRTALGPVHGGRPDYSMGFILRALKNLRQGGVLGTLMPAGILSIDASRAWREYLLELGELKFLGLFGEHGLFRHALVEVAATIFGAKGAAASEEYVTLWTSEKADTAAEAMRALRKAKTGQLVSLAGDSEWRISSATVQHLRASPDWRPKPALLEEVLRKIDTVEASRVRDIFHVREGIRTGYRKAFIISEDQFNGLLERERRYFRPIVEGRNIRDGQIRSHSYIFYPRTVGLPPIQSEDDLEQLLQHLHSAICYHTNLLSSGGRGYLKLPHGGI